ncbi:MAG TPA: Gfo/Idh/MocA family oxidoreductase [Actinopolymorphaceae bacterium]
MSKTGPVRVGVIGTGVMGADHVRTVASSVSRAEVTAVSDLDAERAAAAIADVPTARVLPEPLAVVEDPEVDAVVVASADTAHEETVMACLEAGKPVLCEKPLTPTAEGSLRIVAAEVELGRRLVSVGFMRRWDPGYEELRAAVRSEAVGRPLMLHNVHRNKTSTPNAPSANLIRGSAVHEIDVVRWLFDEEIVRGTVHRPRRSGLVVGETQDPLIVVLETESGIVADVEVFVNCQYGYDVRCELVGETGTVLLDGAFHTRMRSAQRVSTLVAIDWRDRFAEAYRRELQDWIDGIRVDEQRGPTAWDGYAATAVSAACVEALESGRTTNVELAARPDLYA